MNVQDANMGGKGAREVQDNFCLMFDVPDLMFDVPGLMFDVPGLMFDVPDLMFDVSGFDVCECLAFESLGCEQQRGV